MRKMMVVYNAEIEHKYESIFEVLKKRFDVERLCIEDGTSLDEYNSRLSGSGADYISSLDMAGFQLNTLLDYPAYNIMREKQMHIIIDEAVFPQYAEADFAVHLFLYVPESAEKWRCRYPHIPNIDDYVRLEEDEEGTVLASGFNETALNAMIDRFLEEVEG
mgnify:CR=1 FL=1